LTAHRVYAEAPESADLGAPCGTASRNRARWLRTFASLRVGRAAATMLV
jgi:hypothetical protein